MKSILLAIALLLSAVTAASQECSILILTEDGGNYSWLSVDESGAPLVVGRFNESSKDCDQDVRNARHAARHAFVSPATLKAWPILYMTGSGEYTWTMLTGNGEELCYSAHNFTTETAALADLRAFASCK